MIKNEISLLKQKVFIVLQNGKINEWDKFRAFVEERGDKTQTEMAQLSDGEISQRTISAVGEEYLRIGLGFIVGFRPSANLIGGHQRD